MLKTLKKIFTKAHEEKETLSVEVNIPEHKQRGSASALFVRTRKQLIDRDGGKCFICGRNEQESGYPLEAHHSPIERCVAEIIDWELFKKDALSGLLGEHIKTFDWANFDSQDPYSFVDNMMVNGALLCKDHHIGLDEGIHTLPYPLWIAQKYVKNGYKFSDFEIIHHSQE
jgi:hypothetical protein